MLDIISALFALGGFWYTTFGIFVNVCLGILLFGTIFFAARIFSKILPRRAQYAVLFGVGLAILLPFLYNFNKYMWEQQQYSSSDLDISALHREITTIWGPDETLYSFFSITERARYDDILQAYHRKMQAWQERGRKDDDVEFDIAGEAAHILKDVRLRARYDTIRKQGKWPRGRGRARS